MALTAPLDFNAVRKAIVDEVQKVTGLVCIVQEGNTQNAARPALPYFGLKLTTPAGRLGDDSAFAVSGTVVGRGGNRRLVVSFHCYAESPEEAYNYMLLWQQALELVTVQTTLRKATPYRIAVWLPGNVADLSQLLNTGYEGRSQMDVQFGISSNMQEDLGEIDTAQVSGTAQTPNSSIPVGPFNAPS